MGQTGQIGFEFGILGPLEVAFGGQPIGLRREKERLLLATLLLHLGEVVPLEHLGVALWEDADTPHPPATLRVHVSRLRQALTTPMNSSGGGVGPAPVVTTARGYTLEVPDASLDAKRF